MGEKVVSGRTRGEHGRGLDLDRITEIQGHTFVCPKTENLIIQLRKDKKVVIDGEVITQEGLHAAFNMHRFATKNDELADLLRNSAAFKRGEVKELAAAKKDSAAAKVAKVQAMLDADPDLLKTVEAMVKKKDAGDEPTTAPKKTRTPRTKKS